jgi:hypothetical protein
MFVRAMQDIVVSCLLSAFALPSIMPRAVLSVQQSVLLSNASSFCKSFLLAVQRLQILIMPSIACLSVVPGIIPRVVPSMVPSIVLSIVPSIVSMHVLSSSAKGMLPLICFVLKLHFLTFEILGRLIQDFFLESFLVVHGRQILNMPSVASSAKHHAKNRSECHAEHCCAKHRLNECCLGQCCLNQCCLNQQSAIWHASLDL